MNNRVTALAAAALLLAGCAPQSVTPAEETVAGGYAEQRFSMPEGFSCEALVPNADSTLTLYGGTDNMAWRDPAGVRGGVLACAVQPDGTMQPYTPAWNAQLLEICADTPGIGLSLAADEAGAVYLLADQPGGETPFRLWKAEGEALAEIPVELAALAETPQPDDVVYSLRGVSGEYLFVETNTGGWAIFGVDGTLHKQGAEQVVLQPSAVRSGYAWVGTNGFAAAYTLPDFEPASRLSLPDGRIFPDWEGRGFYHVSAAWEGEAVVSHYTLDGDTREILMRGGDYSWGAPSAGVYQGGETPDGALWLLVSEQAQQTLCRYVYDPHRTVENTLTVYSLRDSDAVRQAISLWNSRHPTVRVEYTVGMPEEQTGVREEDVIRRLNTQLLSGDGPNLLFLDGLPVQSMIDQGLLTDLAPLADWSAVRENLLAACAKDGAVYGVPTGFATWIAGGRPEDVDDRLTTLTGLAEAAAQSGESPCLALDNLLYEQLFDLLYPASASAIWEDGAFRPDACRAFLTELDALAGAAGLPTISTYNRQHEEGTSAQELYEQYPVQGTLSDFHNRESGEGGRWFVEEWDTMPEAANFSVLVRDETGRLAPSEYGEVTLYPMPGVGGGGWFAAKGVAAIPRTSEENRALAIEFIQLLLSDEMQKNPRLEGLPVTRSGWTAALDEVKKTDPFGTTGDLDAFVDSLRPVWIDGDLQGVVRRAAAEEYSGQLSMEAALHQIEQEAALRLAEQS